MTLFNNFKNGNKYIINNIIKNGKLKNSFLNKRPIYLFAYHFNNRSIYRFVYHFLLIGQYIDLFTVFY